MDRVSSGVTRSMLGTKRRRTAYGRRCISSTILCRASLYLFTNTCTYILPTVSSTSVFHNRRSSRAVLVRAVLRVEIETAVEFGERGCEGQERPES